MGGSRRIPWIVFAIGVVAVADVLGWVSWRMLRLEREQADARAEAARQEALGRALWRMDSIVLPLLAVEGARPYFEYLAFYPANRPYERMWDPPSPDDVLIASALLGEPRGFVRLHFERDERGMLTSPQVPIGEPLRDAAASLGVARSTLSRTEIRLYELGRLGGGLALAPEGTDTPADALSNRLARDMIEAARSRAEFADSNLTAAASESSDEPTAPARASPEAAPLGSAPPPSGAAKPPVVYVADERQDYAARQQAVNIAQTFVDNTSANRSRSVDQRAPQIQTFESPADPESANTESLAIGPQAGRPAAPTPVAPQWSESQPLDAQRRADTNDSGATPRRGVMERSEPGAGPQSAALRVETDVAPGSRGTDGASAQADSPMPPAPAGQAEASDFARQVRMNAQALALAADTPLDDEISPEEASQIEMPEPEPLRPEWRGAAPGELVLVRRVRFGDRSREQGVWIDWPALRRELEASVADLFPLAELRPVPWADTRPGDEDAQRLATIPVVLVPGPLAAAIAPAVPGFWTPTRWTLLVGWVAVGAAAVALGVVLRKAIELGERRGRFVSAVTHELRTPLTTFRLYSQLLARGQADEQKRTRYAQTLDRESQRLAAIVESVLEYARLGRRTPRRRGERHDARDLLARVAPALEGRAERAGMTLQLASPPAATVGADADKVERILLNLVDNACKYAGESEDRRITIDAEARDGVLTIGVRDRGPGVPASERRRIFGAFHRARRDQDSASPGLGLGLALSRGLAREMGGELSLAEHPGPGASFELRLPLTEAGGAPS